MRVLASLSLVLAFAGCKKPQDGGQAAAKPAAVPPVKVSVVTASNAPVPDVLVLTGTIAADQRSDVTADTQGKVINVLIERGQRVKLGQPVVQLDVRTAALSAREAQANLAATRAQKELADEECARTKSLLSKGAITQSEYDRQNTECLSSLQQVAAAQARAEMTLKSVSDGMVRAPFDGLVDEKDVSPGEWVSPGKTLFTLVKDDPLKIELSVPESAVAAVQVGQHVELSAVAFPGKHFGAKVTRIGAEIGKSRALIAEAQIDEGSGLVPGMFAEAHLQIGTTPHVVVPASAVVKRGKIWHAFVIDKNGEAEDRPVHLGEPPDADHATILEGVAQGEQVITNLTDAVADGTKVTTKAGA
jgi:membrane fusion protein (multidrug efflux system)